MYIVYYWKKCRIVGEYLTNSKFDDIKTAKRFAKKHGSRVERIYF